MNPVRILRASAATVVVALSLLVLRAAERPAIVGSWNCVSSAPDGYAQTWTLTVTKQDDGKLAARVGGGSLGDVAVTDFKAGADNASFTAETGGNTYSVKLAVNGSKLEGTFEKESAFEKESKSSARSNAPRNRKHYFFFPLSTGCTSSDASSSR